MSNEDDDAEGSDWKDCLNDREDSHVPMEQRTALSEVGTARKRSKIHYYY